MNADAVTVCTRMGHPPRIDKKDTVECLCGAHSYRRVVINDPKPEAVVAAGPPGGGPLDAWGQDRLGGPLAVWKVRASVIARDGHRCRSCGGPGPLEAHHREAFASGGAYVPSNLISLCHACHVRTFE